MSAARSRKAATVERKPLDPDAELLASIDELERAVVELQGVREGLLTAHDGAKTGAEQQQAAWGAEAWANKLAGTAGVLGARCRLALRMAQREEGP